MWPRPIVQYEEENWEEEGEARADHDMWKPLDNFSSDKVSDWLEADDPALFSDEFSEPEEWFS